MKKERERPIGVIDSGNGGLTVLEWLQRELPNENFVYIADRAYYPYGEKSKEELLPRLKKLTRFLVSYPVKSVVLACNTASVFREDLQAKCPVPVVGAVAAVCKVAAQKSKSRKVIVLATTLTVQSGIYARTLKEYNIESVNVPCPSFVRMAEEGVAEEAELKRLLLPLKELNADLVIHGCTHFGLLEEEMKKILPEMKFLSCGEWQAKELRKILIEKNELNKCGKRGKTVFFTTE